MRLWSLHPKHLDSAGLVAAWREGLLAKAVLQGRTRGYRAHPQLDRFRSHATPRSAMNAYLHAIRDEAVARGYSFDRSKLGPRRQCKPISVTTGQLSFEWKHLRRKLRRRSYSMWARTRGQQPSLHPLLRLTTGPVEVWERAGARQP